MEQSFPYKLREAVKQYRKQFVSLKFRMLSRHCRPLIAVGSVMYDDCCLDLTLALRVLRFSTFFIYLTISTHGVNRYRVFSLLHTMEKCFFEAPSVYAVCSSAFEGIVTCFCFSFTAFVRLMLRERWIFLRAFGWVLLFFDLIPF